ncbi:MAG TPA: hypothetical protein VHP33_22665 [Polyangiaceae bacterium]|nr:hypothetical protein [Polyangiaceae bacterium]
MSEKGPEFRSAARPLRHFGLFLPLAAAAVAIFGLVRLGRQFPAAAASPTLLVPFLLPVLALALEAGALVALSAAQLRARPAATSTFSERCRATLPLLAVAALVMAGAELVPRGTEHPGAFANDLVATARASCEGNAKVPIPLLGLSVSCAAPQRIEGPMPGVRSVQVAMTELVFSDDLRGVDIVGLDLTAARALRVHLVAGRARIAGLAPWSRSPRLSPLARLGMLAGLGALLWLAVNLSWRSPSGPSATTDAIDAKRWHRVAASLLFAVPGAAVAAGFIALDQERAAPAAYASAALLGLLGLGLVRLLERAAPRIFRSFNAL